MLIFLFRNQTFVKQRLELDKSLLGGLFDHCSHWRRTRRRIGTGNDALLVFSGVANWSAGFTNALNENGAVARET